MPGAEFSGNYTHNIDPKGRVTIPAAYREALGDHFTIGLNNEFNAIALYPTEKWQDLSEKLDRIPDSDVRGMAYVRLIKAFSFTNQ
ncbi:MAG: MraZ N-terminal domain containing protein, partial [Clostridia bacterium]|nr:MraZ N-terminal domain containing protein [Clostridia bacterium]